MKNNHKTFSIFRTNQRIASSPNYKWWAFIATAIGIFLTVMDQSSLTLAVPKISEEFGLDIPTAQWIVLGYILSTSALLMPMGRIADVLCRDRVFALGVIAFTGFALFAGISPSIEILIFVKILQGVAAAAIQANGMAIIIDVFPNIERGKALGMHMSVIGVGSISGPIIGGTLVNAFGWRSIFFLTIPVGIMAVIFFVKVIKKSAVVSETSMKLKKFDWTGAAISSLVLILFLVSVSNAHKVGWFSLPITSGLILSCSLLIVFIFWESRSPDPMLDLSLFKDKLFSIGVSARFFSFLAGSFVYFLMPFLLIQAIGYNPRDAGFLMLPGAISIALMGPLTGRLSDHFGTRWLGVLGMGFTATAMYIFSSLDVTSSPIHVISGMILLGSGLGTFSSTNTSAVTSIVGPDSYGIASAFLNVTRTSGNLTGIALATSIVAVTMASNGYEPNLTLNQGDSLIDLKNAFISGIHNAYLTATGIAVISMVLCTVRGESKFKLT